MTPPTAPPIDALATLLDEELAIYQRLETLADAESAALRDDALDDLSAIIAEQLALVDELAGREQARRGLVAPCSTLSEVIETWGASAAGLSERREVLILQIERVRRANDRNRAIVAALLQHHQDRLKLALEERSLYGEDGQARPTALRSLVDRRV